MNNKLLTAFVVSGMLSFTAQAQTTPTGTAPAGSRTAGTTATPVNPTSKTSQANSGDTAPNRSSTAGSRNVTTSNNPVDATGKPVGDTQLNNTSTGKSRKPKN